MRTIELVGTLQECKMELPIYFQRAEGLVIFITSVYFYFRAKGSVWMFLVLLLVPDICMVGYLGGKKLGAVAYNIGHSLVLPLLLLATGLVLVNTWCILLALIWLAHIGMDRFFGYGLKTSEGFSHTHLGMIGKHSHKKKHGK